MGQNEIIGSSDVPGIGLLRVAAMDEAVTGYLAQYHADNTRRAYTEDWRTWLRYCTALAIPPTAVTTGTLVGFVRWMSLQGMAPKTMQRRLTGVRVTMNAAGHPIPADVSTAAAKALKIERQAAARADEQRGRGKAPAITIAELRAMAAACPPTLAGTRTRALLMLGFGVAGRRHEIAGLHTGDINQVDEGLLVTIRWGKTGAREIGVPYGANLATCPVRNWRAWHAAAALGDGPAFRHIDRHGRILDGLSPQAIGDIVTRTADAAGLPHRTAHGLRSGLATEARRGGHDAVAIAAQGGWSPASRELFGYMQIVDRWTDNAASNIGL
jgi:integrase